MLGREGVFILPDLEHWETAYGRKYPTGAFTILEPRDAEICEFHVVQKRLTTDF